MREFETWHCLLRSQIFIVYCNGEYDDNAKCVSRFSHAAVGLLLLAPEQAMGRWVVGQLVKWVIFDGSRGSWVSAC